MRDRIGRMIVAGVAALVVVVMMALLTGCGPEMSKADKQQMEDTNRLTEEANRQVGMPAITNFRERRIMKMILELRDQEDLICYAYAFSEMTGKFTYMGRCVGYGLPYSVQYTNPERIVRLYKGGGYETLPQPDPNGMFMPQGLSATWVLMLDKDGNPRPEYFEPLLSVCQFPKPDSICTNPQDNPDRY